MKKITGLFAILSLLLFFGCQKETNQTAADNLIQSAKKPGPAPSPSIIQWQSCFGTPFYDHGNDVAIGNDGSIYIVGVINSSQIAGGSNNASSAYIMKLNSNHEPAWSAPTIISGNAHDELMAVAITPDGGCIVAGTTHSTDIQGFAGGSDVLLAKVSATGEVEWQSALGTAANEKANDIIFTTDNGYALTGYSDDDLLVIKLKSSAATTAADMVEWQREYSLPGYKGNSGYVINELNNEYVVAGRTLTIANVDSRPLFARISALDGTAQQIKAIENFTGGFARTLTSNQDNTGFVLAGRIGCEALLFSVDQNGNPGWNKTFGGAGCLDMFDAIVKITDGYLLAGVTNSKNGDITGSKGGTDLWLFKTSTDGARISSYNLGGRGDDRAYAIGETTGSAYMVVGSTSSNSGDVSGFKGGSDIWAVKVHLP